MEGEVSIEIAQKPKVIFWYKTCFSVLLLSGSVWCHRQAYTVGPWPAGPLHQICEGAVGDRTKLRQAAQVCSFWMVIRFYMKWDHGHVVFFLCALTLCMIVKWMFFQLSNRNLTKRYAKRGNKEDQDCKWEKELVSSSSFNFVTFLDHSFYLSFVNNIFMAFWGFSDITFNYIL